MLLRNVVEPVSLTVKKQANKNKKQQKHTGQLKIRSCVWGGRGLKNTHSELGQVSLHRKLPGIDWDTDKVDGTGNAVYSCTVCALRKGTTLAR